MTLSDALWDTILILLGSAASSKQLNNLADLLDLSKLIASHELLTCLKFAYSDQLLKVSD